MRLRLLALLMLLAPVFLHAQDSLTLYDKAYNLPDKLFGSIHNKSEKFQQSVLRATAKYINKLQKQELKMKRKLMKTDSAAAEDIFGDVKAKYADLENKMKNPADVSNVQNNDYVRKLDSLKTSMQFAGRLNIPGKTDLYKSKISGALKNYDGIQSRLNQTRDVQQLLVERQQMLKQKLSNLKLNKQFLDYQKQIYYYRDKMQYYKESLNNPQRLEKEILTRVSKLPAFEKFFNKYSDLAGLFRLPQDDEPLSAASLGGLQTREMLRTELQQRFGTGPNVQQYVRGGMADAQAGLNNIKDKLKQVGSSGENMDMPDFKPNNEKSKTFLKRLVFGSNIQSTKSSYFFVSTTDIGLSAGYKLSKTSVIGIGASYKMGWGRDIRHVSISHQGFSVRSYTDIKIVKSFFLSGGFEMNYLKAFKTIEQLKNTSDWQKSGLIGISKKIPVKNKFLKNTKLQLMWDFLSYYQKPTTQPIIYRLGYDF